MRIVGPLVIVGLLLAGCGGQVPPRETGAAGPGATAPVETQPAEPGWVELPDAPLTPRHDATAVWVDEALLIFGGRDTPPCPPGADCPTPEQPPLRDGARFDPAAGGWTTIEDLPVALGHTTTAVVDGVVYVWSPGVGFDAAESVFLSYDPIADQWLELPPPPPDAGRSLQLEASEDDVLFVQGSHENDWRPDLRYDTGGQTYTDLPQDPLSPSFDRDLTYIDGILVLTGIDVTDSPGGADGPAAYRAATWTASDGWRELPPGDVVGYSPDWFAVDGTLVNPTPGGTDGGETNPYERVHPFGGVLDPHTGTWTGLPETPDQTATSRLELGRALGDGQLLVSSSGLALQPDQDRWLLPGAPDGAPEQGSAAAVGDGRLWIFGGATWSGGTEATLLDRAWVWEPPAAGDS